MTAHKILIAAAILFFFLYGAWELRHVATAGLWAAVRSGVSVAVTVAFLLYFRSLGKA